MINKTELRDGQVSQYGFMCGYVQKAQSLDHEIELYADGAVYAVKVYVNYRDIKTRVRTSWYCYDGLTEARFEFKKLCRAHGMELRADETRALQNALMYHYGLTRSKVAREFFQEITPHCESRLEDNLIHLRDLTEDTSLYSFYGMIISQEHVDNDVLAYKRVCSIVLRDIGEAETLEQDFQMAIRVAASTALSLAGGR